MQLGVMLGAVDLGGLERKAALAERAGYAACQVTFRWDVSPGEAVIAEEICRRHGLDLVACGAYINLLRPDDATFHGVSVQAVHGLTDAMPQLSARSIVVWSGTYGRRLPEGHPDNWTPAARDAIRIEAEDLATRLRMHGGFLCVEPYYMHVLRTPEEYVEFALAVDPDVVRVVLDPPNLIPPEDLPRLSERVPAIVQTLAPVTGLVHLKDICRRSDGTVLMPGPGKGAMEYARFIEAIRACGITAPAIIEHVDDESVREMEEARLFVEQFL